MKRGWTSFLSSVPLPPCPSLMGASSSTSRRKSFESVHPQKKSAAVYDYQVFLSFRGPDTRNSFTDVLYYHMVNRAGIRVFRDEDEVSLGQPIDKILQAIENSEICVPIFSNNFASSAWCLREVEKMVELKKIAMPIFYEISPDEVKLKKTDHLYNKAMEVHEVIYGKEQVGKWKLALKEIAGLKGMEFSADRRFTEFSKEFVNEVLSKLKPRKRSNTQHLVGMDGAIESVMELIDTESPDVRYIGIHGLGGIGKSTLAKALFAKLSPYFDSSCCLKDVRESWSRNHGFEDLQKQLQARLDPEIFTRGCNSSSVGV